MHIKNAQKWHFYFDVTIWLMQQKHVKHKKHLKNSLRGYKIFYWNVYKCIQICTSLFDSCIKQYKILQICIESTPQGVYFGQYLNVQTFELDFKRMHSSQDQSDASLVHRNTYSFEASFWFFFHFVAFFSSNSLPLHDHECLQRTRNSNRNQKKNFSLVAAYNKFLFSSGKASPFRW